MARDMKFFNVTMSVCILQLLSVVQMYAQEGQPCDRCVTVLSSKIDCPSGESGQLQWSLTIRNDSNFAITYAFFLQTPTNIQVAPNPYIFNPALQPGEVRQINFTLSGAYLGYTQLCFDMVFYDASLSRCCRLQHCVNLPRCCFSIRREQVVCEPHSGDFQYNFTIFSQFPAIVQYVVVVSQTPGVTVTPAVSMLIPPIGFLGSANLSVRIQGASPGQTVRLAIGLLDFTGGLCCSIIHEVTMPPCCFDPLDPVVECTDEGIFYEFTLQNWGTSDICSVVVFPQTQGVSVQPNIVQLNSPLGYGQSRRIRLKVLTTGCGGEVCLQLLLLDCMFRMCCSKTLCFEIPAPPVSRLWTTTQDFAEGEQDNVDISNDEIKLPREQQFEYPWVWITNFGPGTISKIDARSHKEVARYQGPGGNVSRTAVDRFGNVWVECRGDNSVIQILDERNWTLAYDFNGNGQLDTSRDSNANGCIEPNEMLPFGQDELVVRYYKFSRTTHVFPRALCVDLNGYLWVGFSSSRKIVQVDPNLPVSLYKPPLGGTPPLLEDLVNTPHPYGFVTSSSGYLYGTTLEGRLFEWCPGDPNVPNDAVITQVVTVGQARDYGIAVDDSCTIWASDFNAGRLIRWVPSQGQAGVSVSTASTGGQHRGVNIDFDGNVWTSHTSDATLVRWDPGTLTPTSYTDACSVTHSGIGIAHGGQIVNPSFQQQTVTFFTYNSVSNTITQTGCVNCRGISPYNYNDFTGALLRYALNEGTWRTVYDGGCDDRSWGSLNWNAFVPAGTSISVRVRAGNSLPILTDWITVSNGEEFCLHGRYLQIEVRLSQSPRVVGDCRYDRCAQQGEFITPILYDIQAASRCDCTQLAGTVRGHVFCDTERDGVQGPNDRPLIGWTIVIEDRNGNQLSEFSDANGEYRFENIPEGEYRLVQITPPGWLPIVPSGGETEVQVTHNGEMLVNFANALLGDVNGDQCVDDADLLAVLFAFGSSGENLPEDIDRDGLVDDSDVLLVLFNFGVGC